MKNKVIKAIVYKSETGHTKKYAELLGEKVGLPVYELKTAVKELPKALKSSISVGLWQVR